MDKPAPPWQAITAIATIVVSLFGNVIQYRLLQAKETELAQAQQKIDAARRAGDDCRQAVDDQLSEFRQRMETLNGRINDTKADLSARLLGARLHPEDKAAIEWANAANETWKQLEGDKKVLQNNMDATAATKARCPSTT